MEGAVLLPQKMLFPISQKISSYFLFVGLLIFVILLHYKEILPMNYPMKPIKDLETLSLYEETLFSLCATHRSVKEICSALMCDIALLNEYSYLHYERDFDTLLETLKDRSNHALVSKEYEVAYSGNSKMLQFLGKNYAKQTDDTNVSALISEQVTIVDDFTISEDTCATKA